MQKVKLNYVGFWKSFDIHHNLFQHIISSRYDIEISDKPDFLICSPLGKPYEYENFDCPRIMYTGEFLSADFNAVDYFIGFDYIDFGDRSFRYPLFLYSDDGQPAAVKALTHDEARTLIRERKYFCNYIFGHQTELGKREEILKRLSAYKPVASAGKHLNNMPDGRVYGICEKREILGQSKFSITAESVSYPGFTSEKIMDAFREHSVPVYYGDPVISKEFNSKAFVNCKDFESIEQACAFVQLLDTDEEKLIDMMCQPIFNEAEHEAVQYKKLEEYILNIFSQDKESAYRRPRFYRAGWHETYLKEYNRYMCSIPHKILKKLGI